MSDDYNFLDDWSLGDEEQPTKEATPEPDEQPTVKRSKRRHAACIELSERYLYRRDIYDFYKTYFDGIVSFE